MTNLKANTLDDCLAGGNAVPWLVDVWMLVALSNS